MRMKLTIFSLEEEENRNVDNLGIDSLCIDSGSVVCKPNPIIVALSNTQFKFLFLDFNIQKHTQIL